MNWVFLALAGALMLMTGYAAYLLGKTLARLETLWKMRDAEGKNNAEDEKNEKQFRNLINYNGNDRR